MESIQNKKAYFDYKISDTLDVGIELLGHEVKAIRSGKANLVGALVKIYGGQLWLVGATIGPYQEKNTPPGFDPQRSRRLLAKKSEIASLVGQTLSKNLTLVPIKLYNKKGLIKLEIGLGARRKKHDKRELIRTKESKKEIGRRINL